MAFYGQKNYQDKVGNGKYTIAQIGCFVTAFCNLLQRYGKNVDPPSLNRFFGQNNTYLADPADGAGVRDDLGWPSITAYDGAMHVVQTGGDSWPSSNNAIVKFDYIHNGIHSTHFCLVADHVNHTIVDSWDGIIKAPGYYGEPKAWAIYDETQPQPVIAVHPEAATTPAPSKFPPSSATEGDTYTFQPGDTVWAVALKRGFTAAELIQYNGIDPAKVRDIPVGYVIHFPVTQAPAPVTSGIKYEILKTPKEMHISKPGGADKWAFGNVKTWSDFVSNGKTPENTNLTIVGIATVIVGNDTAAYYMEASMFGDYATTGHVNNTIGYNWKDLSDGFFTPPEPPAPEPEPTKPAKTDEVPTPKQDVKPAAPLNKTISIPAAPEAPGAFKITYKEYPKPVLCIAVNSMMIKELDGRRPDHPLHKNQGVSISGTFTKDGVLYGRPTAGVGKGYWFAVPMDNIISEDDLFNTQVDLPDKVAMHSRLTKQEKVTVFFAQTLALGAKLSSLFGKKK